MHTKTIALLTALLLSVALPALAKGEKVDLCHAGDDGWHRISVSTNAAEKHLENHGDYVAGESLCDVTTVTYGANNDWTYLGDGLWVERGDGTPVFYFRETGRSADAISMLDVTNEFRGPGFDYREGWGIELRLDAGQIWFSYTPPTDYFGLYAITGIS